MFRKLLVAIVLMAVGLNVWAYDFEVPQTNGYSLYFNIINSEENFVEITYPSTTDNGYWHGYATPHGTLSIPALVENDGIGYIVTAIGERAFSGCTDITSLYLPSTLEEIGAYAFNQCYGIQGNITIGEHVTAIGKSAFYGCSSITGVQFNAVSCETMGGTMSATVFGGCRSLTSLLIGPKVKRIPDYAFYGMDQLNSAWNLPESIEYIGEYAFAYCSKMKGTVTLTDNISSISPYAFAQCHNLTRVDLSGNTTRIGTRAFYQCINLRLVSIAALVPPAVDDDAFSSIASDATLQVPCASETRYRRSSGWNTFRSLLTVAPCTLEIKADVNEPTYGSVIGAGQYKVGQTATLIAVCNAGHSFIAWHDGDTQNPRSISVEDTATFVAIMQPNEVEYIHDTTYMEGTKITYEYYEINDVAQPITSQQDITYNRAKQRIEIAFPKRSIVSVDLYNAAGECISSGRPSNNHIDMKRLPSGNYMIRVTTLTERRILRFFHTKNK